MFAQVDAEVVPRMLRGVVLVDSNHVPRYWAAVWLLVAGAQWATSTQTMRLRYIENLYEHADRAFKANALDDALSELDDSRLADILESWFVSLRNQPVATRSNEDRWQTGLSFVTSVVNWLSKSADAKMRQIEARIHRLSALYSQLHIRQGGRRETVRSLPASVVESLYQMLDPESDANPFQRARTRWRVFIAFVLMLHQGLRRGELLLLPADAIKSGHDRKLGRTRYWLNIQQNDYEEAESDSRYSKPSIKTLHSVRQIPVSDATARLVQTYCENYRGRPSHSFMLSAQTGGALSTESLTKIFATISESLPPDVLQELRDRTGKKSVTCHDLRHTCAVLRLHQLLERGDAMPEALQKLRTFFGWSKESDMPSRYARAVFESRLASVWNDEFDDRVAVLRALPRER
ncbi:tyrosine-type recombinase/integrase [Ralstonia pseudosolanacearum]|uniref:tyrosine-type recombinase/integrase n=1 Tax=Ralstonia pseudosolanacearum TaxID=1310165 RepID=UPI0018D032B0|nr:tyrosine-type recombinase/integrase [Ralstonia pseudosolanacearum]